MIEPNRTMKQGWHVTWVDNFSKNYASNLQSIAQGSYQGCLWTGEAIMSTGTILGAPPLVNDLTTAVAVPGNLFNDRVLARGAHTLRVAMKTMTTFERNSICTQFNVNNLPPLPVIGPDHHDSDLKERISNGSRGLQHFMPVALHSDNIGSNDGLMMFMRRTYDTAMGEHITQRRVRFILADVNIFKRMMKV